MTKRKICSMRQRKSRKEEKEKEGRSEIRQQKYAKKKKGSLEIKDV